MGAIRKMLNIFLGKVVSGCCQNSQMAHHGLYTVHDICNTTIDHSPHDDGDCLLESQKERAHEQKDSEASERPGH